MSTTEVVPATPAEELSPEEKKAAAEAAFVLQERVKEGLNQGRQALWIVAAALYEFEETAGWVALGFEKKSDWLADVDIQMTRRTYNRLVHAWRTLVVQRQLTPGDLVGLDVSKVDIVLPRVETGEVKLETALDDAKNLGAKDLREAYMKPPLGRPPKVDGEAPTEPPPPSEDETGADASTPTSEPETPPEEPEEVSGEIVVDEEMQMRVYDARKASETAMTAWNASHTERAGALMYEALRQFMAITDQSE